MFKTDTGTYLEALNKPGNIASCDSCVLFKSAHLNDFFSKCVTSI